jgi:glycerol-3-phosphate dehydrogenase (NAD(P)+)
VNPGALGILGAGAFGTALAHVVAGRGGTEVHLHADDEATAREIHAARRNERRLPGVALDPGIHASSDLAQVVRAARLLVIAVPSPRVADLVRSLGPLVDGRHEVVHALGAYPERTPVSNLIRLETGVKRIGALAGPALARDLVERRPCAVVIASPFDEVIARTRAALDVPGVLRVYRSHDLVGAELAAALSGAMTVAIGLVDGIGLGTGVRAVVMCRAVAEAARLGVAAGARERTFGGLAGLGNLLVRASSASADRSEDYQLGLSLARGEPARQTEGARAAQVMAPLGRKLGVRTPILDALCAILSGTAVKDAARKIVETTAEEE